MFRLEGWTDSWVSHTGRGEVLVGCIECNRWDRPGDKTLIMELLEADLEALRDAFDE
jgi:hypothetical protein